VQHLPGVGQNFQDHFGIGCVWEYRQPLTPHNNAGEATYFWKSDSSLETPDLQTCQGEIPLCSAETAARFLGNTGRTLMLAGLVISAFGWTASDILSSPRIIFAFGRDGVIPKWFAHVHRRFHTPDVAILTYAAIAFGVSYSSTFQKLAVLSNMAVLFLYFLCCLAALVLSRRDVRSDGRPFEFRGASIVPILAIILIVWILAHATKDEFEITGACLAVASILFLLPRLYRVAVAKNSVDGKL